MRTLFEKKGNRSDQRTEKVNSSESINRICMQEIVDAKKENSLAGIKIGANEVLNIIINMMKSSDEKGVHLETLLCILGSLAGYSCQAGVRSKFIDEKGFKEANIFVIVEGADGKRYYFSDMINKLLVEGRYSIWSLSALAVGETVAERFDRKEIFQYTAQTVGSSSFGIPRITEEHSPKDMPYNYVKFLWQLLLPTVRAYCKDPEEWPKLFGLAIQEAIGFSKEQLDPFLALTIVMESAIPMSKVEIAL